MILIFQIASYNSDSSVQTIILSFILKLIRISGNDIMTINHKFVCSPIKKNLFLLATNQYNYGGWGGGGAGLKSRKTRFSQFPGHCVKAIYKFVKL